MSVVVSSSIGQPAAMEDNASAGIGHDEGNVLTTKNIVVDNDDVVHSSMGKLVEALRETLDAELAASSEEAPELWDEVQGEFSADEMLARGEDMEEQGRYGLAAYYNLYCLDRFRDSTKLDLIARTLQNLARICERSGKYEDALRFRHAEKMLYETQLMQMESHESKRAFIAPVLASSSPALPSLSLEQLETTAGSWEKLAHMFFDSKNLPMAEQYALKAIQIRREIKRRQEGVGKLPEQLSYDVAQQGKESYEATIREVEERRQRSRNTTHILQQDDKKKQEEGTEQQDEEKTATTTAAVTTATTVTTEAIAIVIAAFALLFAVATAIFS